MAQVSNPVSQSKWDELGIETTRQAADPLANDRIKEGANTAKLAVLSQVMLGANGALCVTGTITLIAGLAMTSYGSDMVMATLLIIGVLMCVTGGLGILAGINKWWPVILCLSIFQCFLLFGLVAVGVVCYTWSEAAKSPIATAIDAHWLHGLRTSLETPGITSTRTKHHYSGFCDPLTDAEGTSIPPHGSCFAFYKELQPQTCDKCINTCSLEKAAHNCSQAYSGCIFSPHTCRACNQECRHYFEEHMYQTVRGTAYLGVMFVAASTFKTFFAWYVHQLERRDQHAGAREEDLASRASTINNAIKAGKRSAQQVGPEVRDIESTLGTLRGAQIFHVTWQSRLLIVLHFAVFVLAASVCAASMLTQRVVQMDCEVLFSEAKITAVDTLGEAPVKDAEDCKSWIFVWAGVCGLMSSLSVLLSVYAFHIQYLKLGQFTRYFGLFLLIVYLPSLIGMLFVTGGFRDLEWTIDEAWDELVPILNDDKFCEPDAIHDPADPCKAKVMEEARDPMVELGTMASFSASGLLAVIFLNVYHAELLFQAQLEELVYVPVWQLASKYKQSASYDR